MKIVILGGGLTGLASALFLSRLSGHEIVIIEEEESVGGLARSFQHNGFTFDLGSHVFRTSIETVQSEVERLCKDDLLYVKRKSKLFFDGKFYEYPPNLRELLFNTKPSIVLKGFADYLASSSTAMFLKLQPRTYKEYVIKKFGNTLSELLFIRYAEKVWGLSANELSSELAKKRLPFNDFRDILMDFLPKNKSHPIYYAPYFFLSQRWDWQHFPANVRGDQNKPRQDIYMRQSGKHKYEQRLCGFRRLHKSTGRKSKLKM